MQSKLCLIYNYAQHYRTDIFTLMDKELSCDFVFGDKMDDVQKMNYNLLTHFKKEVKNKTFIYKPLYYQKGVISLLQEDYTTYLILGDLHCVSTWAMLFLAKLSKKRIYLWSHGWYGRESTIKKILKKLFFGLASGTFLYGNYSRNLMIQNGFKESKLFVIYNSGAYTEHIAIREYIKTSSIYIDHFKNNLYNLIFIGRLSKLKRLDLLLSAIAKLKLKSFNVNLTFIGDGEMKDELVNQSNNIELENIWFYGACYDERKLSSLIYNADLCVSPGNVGLTSIHAMAYGTPVLTHNNFPCQMPEFEAIEDGTTGTFFEYESIDSLAQNIIRWFDIAPNREFIRKRCYEIIDSKYNPQVQLETIIKHIK